MEVDEDEGKINVNQQFLSLFPRSQNSADQIVKRANKIQG